MSTMYRSIDLADYTKFIWNRLPNFFKTGGQLSATSQFMHFFLPLTNGAEQAERIYCRIADRLKGMGYVITPHRIARVTYRRNGKLLSDAVGAPMDNGEIVLAIYKNDVGYFLCTYSNGAVWGDPIVIRYTTIESAESFDDDPIKEKEPG